MDPQAGQQKRDQQQGREQPQDREAKNDRRAEGDPANAEYKLEPRRSGDARESWGNLPEKKAAEVLEAQRRPPPPAWKKQIDDYFKRLTRPKR